MVSGKQETHCNAFGRTRGWDGGAMGSAIPSAHSARTHSKQRASRQDSSRRGSVQNGKQGKWSTANCVHKQKTAGKTGTVLCTHKARTPASTWLGPGMEIPTPYMLNGSGIPSESDASHKARQRALAWLRRQLVNRGETAWRQVWHRPCRRPPFWC